MNQNGVLTAVSVSIPDRVLGIFRRNNTLIFAVVFVVSIPDRVLGIFRRVGAASARARSTK